jgi:type I restriction enzyme S subunit
VTENRWHMRAFRECATLVRETVHPDDVQNLPYIGLEHISEGQLSLIGYGTSKEVVSIKSLFRQGDILFGKLRPYFRKIIIAPFDGVCSTDIWVVRAKEGTDQRFLFYWMASNEFIEESTRASEGTKMPRAQWNFIERIVRPVPPLPIQRAIAHVLGTLDDKIELNRQMNATLEAIARALFQSWFVDLDPVRAKAEGRQPAGMDAETAALFPAAFVDSELGKIPKGWRVAPLPEVFEVNPSRSLKNGDIAPYLDMANMPTQGHRAIDWLSRPFGSGTRFINGDTLVARITPCLENGKTAFVDFLADGQVGWGSTEYIVLRPKPPLPLEYAYLLARGEDLRAHLIQNMTGTSGRQRAPTSCLDQYLMVVPSQEVARRFDGFIRPVFATIRANDEQSRTLSALRDTLLPTLISGEIHIKDAEKLVGERL